MKEKNLNENQVAVVLAVFNSILELPYEKQNQLLGSLTIREMADTYVYLNNWYQPEVNGKIYSEELGWIDPDLDY